MGMIPRALLVGHAVRTARDTARAKEFILSIHKSRGTTNRVGTYDRRMLGRHATARRGRRGRNILLHTVSLILCLFKLCVVLLFYTIWGLVAYCPPLVLFIVNVPVSGAWEAILVRVSHVEGPRELRPP